METTAYSLRGWRNVPFPPDVRTFTDDDGVAVPLTDRTLAMDVRVTPGTGTALISIDMAPNESGDGFWVLDAGAGQFRIQIGKAALQAAWDAVYAAGLIKAGEAAVLYYDVLLTDSDGAIEVPIAGTFTIEPGATEWV